MTEQYSQRLCCHEAGRAVVAFSLGVRVVAVSVFFTEKEGWKGDTKTEGTDQLHWKDQIMLRIAGKAAEEFFNCPEDLWASLRDPCVPAPRCAMLVADGDTVVIESDDATFGDCHSKNVACQIAQHGLGAVAPGCAMDDPGLPPGRLGQDEIGPAFGQRSSHLGPHEDGEWPGRDQEVVAGGIPIATVIGHAATGDEAQTS